MPAAVGPGTSLLCIRNNHNFRDRYWWIDANTVYTCREVVPAGDVEDGACPDCGDNHEAFALEGKIRRNLDERSIVYCPTLFIPLTPPDPIETKVEEYDSLVASQFEILTEGGKHYYPLS